MKKLILLIAVLTCLFTCALAEPVWVLCQPDSYVNIRPFASKKHEPVGTMECGWIASTDGTKKNGYLYLDGANTESGDGWIKRGYIVYTEPVIITFRANIYATGRVACWRTIGGDRRCWVKPNESVTVYAVSEEWSVTNKGFIRTKYLGVDYYLLHNKRLDEGQTNQQPDDLYFEDDEG